MDFKLKIIEIVNKKHQETKGHCGTYMVDFIKLLKIKYSQLEPILSEMYNQEQIEIREGVNGYLVMKKNKVK
jgi:hypothetical protein